MTDLSDYTLDQRREAINQVIDSKRDRKILEMRLLDKRSYQEIGSDPEIRLEVRQVGYILSRGSAKVGDYLKGKRKRRFFR